MNSVTVNEINPTLSSLIDTVNQTNQPTMVTINNSKKAVLVSIEEWNSIQETLYLLSIPKVKEDLIEGKNTDWEACTPVEQLDW
jgi:prevent-host-death family protein